LPWGPSKVNPDEPKFCAMLQPAKNKNYFHLMSRLTRTSLMLAFFISVDKGLGFVRQVIIARQFGLSSQLDAFNVANNLPDLLFALISGGALTVAFIPVLSEVLTKEGQENLSRVCFTSDATRQVCRKAARFNSGSSPATSFPE